MLCRLDIIYIPSLDDWTSHAFPTLFLHISETAARSSKPTGLGGEEDVVHTPHSSKLRKRNAALLGDEDKRYSGKRVSRKSMMSEGKSNVRICFINDESLFIVFLKDFSHDNDQRSFKSRNKQTIKPFTTSLRKKQTSKLLNTAYYYITSNEIYLHL